MVFRHFAYFEHIFIEKLDNYRSDESFYIGFNQFNKELKRKNQIRKAKEMQKKMA